MGTYKTLLVAQEKQHKELMDKLQTICDWLRYIDDHLNDIEQNTRE